MRFRAPAVLASFVLAGVAGCSDPGPAPGETGPVSPETATQTPAARASSESETRAVCASRDPLGRAFFGDLHVHTVFSMDAYTAETPGTPDDAYRFARGETIELAGGRTARLERPLDFAAVTDHAEYIGEVSLCTRPGSPVYDSERCARYRGEIGSLDRGSRMGLLTDQRPPLVEIPPFPPLGTPIRSVELCGEDGSRCARAVASVWDETRAAAERWNDLSEQCRFTSFVAYEYTWTPQLSKIHRNVVFRGSDVPARPTSALDEPTPQGLWRRLTEECLEAEGDCDVLAIPHNSNLSNGRMFALEYPKAPSAEQPELARRRARLEPLVEIMQVKGDSECRNGLYRVRGGADELCEFEKFRAADTPDCAEGTGMGALGGQGCVSRLDFVRYALIQGLAEEARIGVNPLKFGIIASTDSHNATPGDTEEDSYDGAHGIDEATLQGRLASARNIVSPTRANPGGLIGVWAPENTRDALFDAMLRRETFGTSGVRIRPRLFAGWDYPEDLCGQADGIERASAAGVPMGGDLPPRLETAVAPVFVAAAQRDPGTGERPGGLLERIQIVKGWVGDGGDYHQAVYDVAGSADGGADVDPETCRPRGPGADSLCAVWSDPDFDPARRAVYYARVLENPSCRWTAWQCLELPEERRPEACADPATPRSVQERAWTSPIWYSPS